jgi:hypothetical protein
MAAGLILNVRLDPLVHKIAQTFFAAKILLYSRWKNGGIFSARILLEMRVSEFVKSRFRWRDDLNAIFGYACDGQG